MGADSIRQGFTAGMLGLFAVILIMLIYYRKAGINATLALILNAVILLAVLSYFDAVLTLPGIAGIVLTIGMAVDSNGVDFREDKGRATDRKGYSGSHRYGLQQGRF